jgi:hypothetical protein
MAEAGGKDAGGLDAALAAVSKDIDDPALIRTR